MSLFTSASRDVFKLAYQISPIILTGGIAQDVPGGLLPLVTITESIALVNGLLNGSAPESLDDYFAQFQVIPGGTLISNQVGQYPFANQQVAANAIIEQPLTISLMMTVTARGAGAYVTKIATMTALQAAIEAHNSSGGLYTVATPAFIYTNCVMTGLTDTSDGSSKQVQYQYQWDFEQPLVTLSAAQQAYNSLMTKLTGGTQIAGLPTWSGIQSGASSAFSGIAGAL